MSDKLLGFVGSVVMVNGAVILFRRVDDDNGQGGLGGDSRWRRTTPCFC